MRPDRAMLVRNVVIGFRNFLRQQQAVCSPARFAQFLKCLSPQHLAERIWRINRAIHQDVRNMDAL